MSCFSRDSQVALPSGKQCNSPSSSICKWSATSKQIVFQLFHWAASP